MLLIPAPVLLYRLHAHPLENNFTSQTGWVKLTTSRVARALASHFENEATKSREVKRVPKTQSEFSGAEVKSRLPGSQPSTTAILSPLR